MNSCKKKITQTIPIASKVKKIDSAGRKITQSGLGINKFKPSGPPGILDKKQREKLPSGWMSFK